MTKLQDEIADALFNARNFLKIAMMRGWLPTGCFTLDRCDEVLARYEAEAHSLSQAPLGEEDRATARERNKVIDECAHWYITEGWEYPEAEVAQHMKNALKTRVAT